MADDGLHEVRLTEPVQRWYEGLSDRDAGHVAAAMDQIAYDGPTLERPLADRIKGSQFQNMKELRPLSTNIRILWAFDRERRAVMLAAGDKTGNWERFYRENIKVADERFARHNIDCGGEYRWHVTGRSTGNRSGDRGR